MFIRLIFLLLLSYLAFKLWKRVMEVLPKGKNPEQKVKDNNSQTLTPLRSCPACGTYFQEHQGVEKDGQLYCSQKCLNTK